LMPSLGLIIHMSKDEERILTKNPQGKTGVSISKAKYDLVWNGLTDCLKAKPLTHEELMACVTKRLQSKFEGSMKWYAEAVEQDMETKGEIERVPGKKHETYRLKKK
jgi:hypothetical protein